MTTTTRDRPLWRGMATRAEPGVTGRPNRPRDADRSHQATLPVFVEASRTGTAAGVQASRKGLANQGGVLRSRDVVEVLHRRLKLAWPIHSWTRRMSATPMTRVPNVWRRS